MTPVVDPGEAANVAHTVHTACDYVSVFGRLWPIALTGGVMGVVIHGREIFNSASRWAAALFLVATEWTVGASAAMVLATLMPSVVGWLPDGVNLSTPDAELGLCGFLGGSFGRRIFRWLWSKLFKGASERENRQ